MRTEQKLKVFFQQSCLNSKQTEKFCFVWRVCQEVVARFSSKTDSLNTISLGCNKVQDDLWRVEVHGNANYSKQADTQTFILDLRPDIEIYPTQRVAI